MGINEDAEYERQKQAEALRARREAEAKRNEAARAKAADAAEVKKLLEQFYEYVTANRIKPDRGGGLKRKYWIVFYFHGQSMEFDSKSMVLRYAYVYSDGSFRTQGDVLAREVQRGIGKFVARDGNPRWPY